MDFQSTPVISISVITNDRLSETADDCNKLFHPENSQTSHEKFHVEISAIFQAIFG